MYALRLSRLASAPFSAGAALAARLLLQTKPQQPSRASLWPVIASGSRHIAAMASQAAYDYDLVAIGAGSGGVRASRFAAQYYGAKVAVVELPFGFVPSDSVGGAPVAPGASAP